MAGESFYLPTHKNPHVPQYGEVRRNDETVSGVIVVHTAENRPDLDGPDTGAEAVARWIATQRTDYGSYHRIADSDSVVRMAPALYETWHERHINPHACSVSAACRAHEWHLIPKARRHRIVDNMALAAHQLAEEIWELERIRVPARRITAAQARARVPGFVGHGETDPTRRSDPGPDFDWDRFLTTYARLQAGGSIEEDDMFETEDRKVVKDTQQDTDRIRQRIGGSILEGRPTISQELDLLVRHARREQKDNAQMRADLAHLTAAMTAMATALGVDADRVYDIVQAEMVKTREQITASLAGLIDDISIDFDAKVKVENTDTPQETDQ